MASAGPARSASTAVMVLVQAPTLGSAPDIPSLGRFAPQMTIQPERIARLPHRDPCERPDLLAYQRIRNVPCADDPERRTA